MPEDAQVRLTVVLTYDELTRILFGAELGPRWSKAKIRAEIQRRIVTWGTAECSRRYKRFVKQAVDAGELPQHFEHFNWYRAHVERTYPPLTVRARRERPPVLGRPLMEVLAEDDLS